MSRTFASGLVFEMAGMLIAGMGLYKTGFITGASAPRLYIGIAILGYAIAIPLVLAGLHHAALFGFSEAVAKVSMFLPYGIEQIGCMFANASILLLLVRYGRLLPMQYALAAVGRSAFSNYIVTTLICQYIFRWGPWKLYGTLEYYQQIYVVIGVWAINILFSTLWLRLFAFGPLEWLWRSLTYWQRQPLFRDRRSEHGDHTRLAASAARGRRLPSELSPGQGADPALRRWEAIGQRMRDPA